MFCRLNELILRNNDDNQWLWVGYSQHRSIVSDLRRPECWATSRAATPRTWWLKRRWNHLGEWKRPTVWLPWRWRWRGKCRCPQSCGQQRSPTRHPLEATRQHSRGRRATDRIRVVKRSRQRHPLQLYGPLSNGRSSRGSFQRRELWEEFQALVFCKRNLGFHFFLLPDLVFEDGA